MTSPRRFVESAYPWGEGLLTGETGPDTWQAQVLRDIEESLHHPSQPVRIAIASGHGIGKGALSAWLTQWFLCTRVNPQVVVTANTKVQLDSKTWRELAKWHRLLKLRDWFVWQATKYFHTEYADTWYASAIPWNAERPEAFAGTHEQHVLLIFDEASAIDDIIWETAEGAMTIPGAIWVVLGNPTRTSGRFRECFPGGRFAHRWKSYQIDARTCKKADQAQLQRWLEDYGEDSDFCRVRVKGQFPKASVDQFISEALIAQAHERYRQLAPGLYAWAPIVMGVDVAWKGADESVIRVRQGGMLLHREAYRELDPAQLGERVIKVIEAYGPDATFIDEVGIGAGTLAYVKMRHYPAIGVNAGKTKENPDPQRYHDWGAYMWGQVKDWLATIGCLDPEDRLLAAQLTSREYSYDHLGRYILESKDELKGRGLSSPDDADALGFTFAQPVTRRAQTSWQRPPPAMLDYDVLRYDQPRRGQVASGTDWDVMRPPWER